MILYKVLEQDSIKRITISELYFTKREYARKLFKAKAREYLQFLNKDECYYYSKPLNKSIKDNQVTYFMEVKIPQLDNNEDEYMFHTVVEITFMEINVID